MWSSSSKNLNNLTSNLIPNAKPQNISQEQLPIYQTPIKQSLNIQNNNNTPLKLGFNLYLGNLWSSGHLPGNIGEIPLNNSVNQHNREANILLLKSSIEKSAYRLTPMSEIKNNDLIGYGLLNNMNNIYENELNQNEFTKKNLSELFNNAKNDEFLQSNKKKINFDNSSNIIYGYNIGNNFIAPNNINPNMTADFIFSRNNNYQYSMIKSGHFEIDKENKNPNENIIQSYINQDYNNNNNIPKYNQNNSDKSEKNPNDKIEEMFNSPINKKPKKIFECSGSTVATNSSKSSTRKRRFRKNNEQLLMLSKFYNENKHWSKNQIKEISRKTGLQENKVYKWLWDQRNKEYKANKFIIDKKNLP